MLPAILKKIPFCCSAFAHVVLLLTLFTSCGPEPERSARVVPEAHQKKKEPMVIRRFDRDLFALKKGYGRQTVDSLNRSYWGFLDRFTGQVINIGDTTNPQYYRALADFLSDPYINAVAHDADSVFRDMSTEEQAFSNAFRAYAYFFPGKKIPRLVAFIGGFNYQVGAWPQELGIGLEFYLGSKHRFYSLLGYPAYKQRLLNRDYLLPDALRGWLSTEFEGPGKAKKFIDQLVYEGKIQYALDQLLPETEDSLRTGYSGKHLSWMQQQEGKIWAYFIERKLLFKPISFDTDKYLNEGPFTPGMPRESPGKIGVWVGRQIVRSYMQNHPEVTLQQLMKNDASKILSQSGYKPL